MKYMVIFNASNYYQEVHDHRVEFDSLEFAFNSLEEAKKAGLEQLKSIMNQMVKDDFQLSLVIKANTEKPGYTLFYTSSGQEAKHWAVSADLYTQHEYDLYIGATTED